ncbi:type I-E CRISPR-associated endonuclease Cas1 [bacterium]|nr:type I-E CRISPR-associated endonuclease Cas1 [bacterium]
MMAIPGIEKPDLHALPTIRERMTYLYVERCLVSRSDGAVTFTDSRGTAFVPAAALSVLMLGPGTNVSHRAIELIGDAGATAIWVGERGVRFYASGSSLTRSSRLIARQAELVSNTRKRLAVAREMYQMRFPNEDVSGFTMQQLRGREGSRIRSVYRAASKEYGVEWHGREYDPQNFDDASDVNKALSAAHACLYGLAHAVIIALGCSPALGFVHTGHDRSFVYDVADLYKAQTTIPLAFQVAAEKPDDIGSEVRRRTRDLMASERLLERMTHDVRMLLLGEDETSEAEVDELSLWDESGASVRAGVSYKETHDKRAYEVDAAIDQGADAGDALEVAAVAEDVGQAVNKDVGWGDLMA